MVSRRNIVTESDLVVPTLRALVEREATGLTTAELQPILREALKPAGDDLILLEGRGDDRFSQKVRNLRSHSRLERDNLATFDGQRYHITDQGRKFIGEFEGVDESFSDQGFSEPSKKEAMKPTKPLVFVEEGTEQKVSASVRRRSKRLRDYALKAFSKPDGTIVCIACGFEGRSVYGPVGKGLIEIHHLEPISLSGATLKPLRTALKGLAPLCPNCHRIVHRKPGEILALGDLIAAIGKAGAS